MTGPRIYKHLSHLAPITVHRFHSELSGPMDVRWENGRLALNSAHANYSYNELHRIFQKGLGQVDFKRLVAGAILNLGMGAGSTVSILRDELAVNRPIVSVEYDPMIIEAAEQFWNIDDYTEHEIVAADAQEFLHQKEERYALILIDLFKDKIVDERFLSAHFLDLLQSRLLAGGEMLFNYIGNAIHPLAQHMPEGSFQLIRIKGNQMLHYRSTEVS